MTFSEAEATAARLGLGPGAAQQQAAFQSEVELKAAVAEWVHETCQLMRYMHEEVYPDTGGVGRHARREILSIHRRKGLELLKGMAPETNAADALREAVAWYELREEALREAGAAVEPWPRWIQWAYRLLPGCGLSRYAKLTDRALREAELGAAPGGAP